MSYKMAPPKPFTIQTGVFSGFMVLNQYGCCLGWFPTRYQARKCIKAQS
jgi:hypothetical protein